MQGKGKSPGARVSSLGCREKKLLGKTGGLGWLEEGERGFPLLGKEGKGLLKGVMSFRNLLRDIEAGGFATFVRAKGE